MSTILLIDDEETFVKNVARYLSTAGHDVFTALNGQEGLGLLINAPDAVVIDYRLPDIDGITLIKRIRERDPHVPILMITGHGSIELAVEAMKVGANDLLTKPVPLNDLRQCLVALIQRQRDSSRLKYLDAKEQRSAHSIIGESTVVRTLRERISRIAELDGSSGGLPPVLIIGETGTGKELVARALRSQSQRLDKPFIEINCAAIPGNLLESELFGHERGAFTDAKERKIGLIEAADEGTLFLDELGEMDLALQAKLLKVLEDGRFRRIGAVQERQVNIRIIAATNQNLEERIQQGAFRADLYFRLRVLQLNVPPLREREGDVLMLAKYFLDQFSVRYRRQGLGFSAAAEAALLNHHWPGNVRELRNVVEQSVLLCLNAQIDVADLLLPHKTVSADSRLPSPQFSATNGDEGSILEALERDVLVKALAGSGKNVSKAARDLGISRDTLRYRMEKYGLK